jgi:integrase
MKFTDIAIRKIKPTEKKYYVRADMGHGKHGFALCVYPSGVKTWFFIYTFEGKRNSLGLGNYPDVSLGDAAVKFDKHWTLYKAGKNPAIVEAEIKDERIKAPTVAKLVSEYLERHAKRFKRSWQEDERILNRDVVPEWGKRKAADITKRDVIRLLDSIVDRGSPAMANSTFRLLRKMFNYAVEKDILNSTPCAGIKLPSPTVARDRVLTAVEIKTFWRNLDACYISDDGRRALKLILVTAQRPGEVAGIHTREIDGRWWTIPIERAKNGRAQRVYLTDLAVEIIGDTKGKSYIFPTPHKTKVRAIDDHALAVAVSRNLAFPKVDDNGKPLLSEDGKAAKENRFGIDHFTPHDLRRTAATFMAEMGTMDEVIDAILNHAKQGVIKVYNQYRYDKEKQAALETWERKLQSIVSGKTAGKVVSLTGKKRKIA